jgi:positive regulator of sigma E activity
MKAQMARFVISLVGMLIALIVFMEVSTGWIAALASVIVALTGFIIAEALFRRFADRETYRRDLEDRVRNPPL